MRISPIQNPPGFTDYRHQSAIFSKSAAHARCAIGAKNDRQQPMWELAKTELQHEMAYRERWQAEIAELRAFEALTPGRQRGYLLHFAGAKRSGTRTGRIEKAMPAIFEGRGFLERRQIVKPRLRTER